MSSSLDKHALIRALATSIEDEIARAKDAANRTREDAVHEEARPENDKDTRALEQTYLARGQALRVVDLEDAHKRVVFMEVRAFGADDPIGISALVTLEDEDAAESGGGARRVYLLAPAGGGRRLRAAGSAVEVHVVTPEAPLGRALVGRLEGDEVELRAGGKARLLTIVAVR